MHIETTISCHVDQVGQNAVYIDCRDSFITKQDKYRWAEPFLLYREDSRPTHNTTTLYKLHETVPDYFSGAVLQRHHLNDIDPGVVTLKFQVAFNLAVVWMIVFVSLSKGKHFFCKSLSQNDIPSLISLMTVSLFCKTFLTFVYLLIKDFIESRIC